MDGTHNTTRGAGGGAVQFGGGVDVRTPIKFGFPIGVRVEVRDLYTSKPNYNLDTGGGFQHRLIISGGQVLRFGRRFFVTSSPIGCRSERASRSHFLWFRQVK